MISCQLSAKMMYKQLLHVEKTCITFWNDYSDTLTNTTSSLWWAAAAQYKSAAILVIGGFTIHVFESVVIGQQIWWWACLECKCLLIRKCISYICICICVWVSVCRRARIPLHPATSAWNSFNIQVVADILWGTSADWHAAHFFLPVWQDSSQPFLTVGSTPLLTGFIEILSLPS